MKLKIPQPMKDSMGGYFLNGKHGEHRLFQGISYHCDMWVFPQTVLETPFHPLTLNSWSISCTFAKFPE